MTDGFIVGLYGVTFPSLRDMSSLTQSGAGRAEEDILPVRV